ncbi:hypothetical protein AOLI_G00250830 [Acnodon oligacanthus]
MKVLSVPSTADHLTFTSPPCLELTLVPVAHWSSIQGVAIVQRDSFHLVGHGLESGVAVDKGGYRGGPHGDRGELAPVVAGCPGDRPRGAGLTG